MKSKWMLAVAVAVMVPALLFAQTDIAVEDTGWMERPLAEGQPFPDDYYVHTILWTDAGDGPYDIYVSAEPITDITAANVYMIADDVPAGQQAYEYALQTPFTPGDVTNYYAVVMDGSDAITAGANATTDGAAGTTEFAQPMYWFTEEPFIDGDFSDWPFEPVIMTPANPDQFIGGEIDDENDFSGNMANGCTADNIYFRAETMDDALVNVNEDNTGGIWQGDFAEWYIGLYDIRPSGMRHPATQFGNESDPAMAEPDWQFGIAGNAFDNAMRSQLYDAGVAGDLLSALGTFGLEVQSIENGQGDGGWSIEGGMPWSGLVLDPALVSLFVPKVGMILGSNYALNDGDDPAGGRQGQLFWARDEAANNSWNTPSAWQKELVIYDPKVFGVGGGGTAVEATSWGQVKAGFNE